MVRGRSTATYPVANVAFRAAGLLLVWLALTNGRGADMPAGLLVVALATWTSLRLLPPAATRVKFAAMAMLALRFLWGSLVAGVDVARRALAPRPALDPGILFFPVRLPPGPARDAFRAIMSLQPGTLPTEAQDRNGFLIHCLDRSQPALATFAAEEAAFARAAGITLPPPRRADG